MKLQALGALILITTGLSACTTVDLSQVAINSEPEKVAPVQQNVVERSAKALTAKFQDSGWCSASPQEKTQTAASVLLNGIDSESTPISPTYKAAKSSQLASHLLEANRHVEQTTKAAEVYLSMYENSSLDLELSVLETALLSAREAEKRFGLEAVKYNNETIQSRYVILQNSVDELKTVTDSYGERIRSDIAAKSGTSRS